MNHLKARKRESDGRWDYTSARDGFAGAIGYCHAFIGLEGQPYASDEEAARHRESAGKYHTDGHATEEEARECYKGYLLDHARYDGRDPNAQHRCKECGEFTQGFAEVPFAYVLVVLCDEHRNRETFAKHVSVGEAWQS
jgi:hypothetical protein